MASLDPNLSPRDNIALSRYAGVADPWHISGYNPAITTGVETVWPVNSVYSFPTSALTMTIVSSDANDDGSPAGTGAQTVKVSGLNSSYIEISETVTMNGTNAVTLTNSYFRINEVRVMTAGSTGSNVGTLTVANGGTTYGFVQATQNVSQSAVYTVPAGRSLLINNFTASTGGTDVFTYRLRERTATAAGGTGLFEIHFIFQGHGSSPVVINTEYAVPEKTDIDMTAIASSGTQIVTATMLGYLYRG